MKGDCKCFNGDCHSCKIVITSLSSLVGSTMKDVDSWVWRASCLEGIFRREGLGPCSLTNKQTGGQAMAAQDNTMEAPFFKILIPIGLFRYGDTSHALSGRLDPQKIRGNGGLRHDVRYRRRRHLWRTRTLSAVSDVLGGVS